MTHVSSNVCCYVDGLNFSVNYRLLNYVFRILLKLHYHFFKPFLRCLMVAFLSCKTPGMFSKSYFKVLWDIFKIFLRKTVTFLSFPCQHYSNQLDISFPFLTMTEYRMKEEAWMAQCNQRITAHGRGWEIPLILIFRSP